MSDKPIHQVKIIPWETDLIGAMVEYEPDFVPFQMPRKMHVGMKGIITDGQWVNNNTVGTSFCAFNVFWLGAGNSKSLRSLAHFTTKDLKVIALPGGEL